MAKKETIHFVLTGGTIDSFWNGKKDTAEVASKSCVPDYIDSLKLHENIEFTEVCMKDSREIVKADMDNVLKTIEKSPHKKFIVTHGTYTMPDTARFIEVNLRRNDTTIVFTGSMTPLLGFSPSDAPFNLGYSMAKIHELPAGYYVCMNGRVFAPDEIIKVMYEGKFSSIYDVK